MKRMKTPVRFYSCKNPDSVILTYDSGIFSVDSEIVTMSKYGIYIGSDKNSEINFEGTYTNVALFEFTGKRVPNYIVRKVFSGAPLDGYGVIPRRVIKLPFPMPMVQGGFVNKEYRSMLMEKVGL